MSMQSVIDSPDIRLKRSSLRSTAYISRSHSQHRLLVLLGHIAGIVILFSCVAIGYGRLQPVSSAVSSIGLARCENIPCYRNYIPGRTRWTEDLAHLNDWPEDATSPYRVSLFPSADNTWLDTVVIPLPPIASVTAGDIVLLYGAPCRIDIAFYPNKNLPLASNVITLHYPQLDAQLDTDDPHLSPHTRVNRIILTSLASPSFRRQSDPCAFDVSGVLARTANVQRPWRGFASINCYLFP